MRRLRGETLNMSRKPFAKTNNAVQTITIGTVRRSQLAVATKSKLRTPSTRSVAEDAENQMPGGLQVAPVVGQQAVFHPECEGEDGVIMLTNTATARHLPKT